MPKERYLAFTDLKRVADLPAGTEVEVVVQSKGGRGRKKFKTRIEEVIPTKQENNEKVILKNKSGKVRHVGGGTSVRRI